MDKRTLKVLSLSTLAILLSSCTNSTPVKDLVPESNFWGISSGVKVVRDRDRGYYSHLEKETRVDLKSCRGEYEMGQLVVTAPHDVDYYYASVSSLKSLDGFSIPSDNVKVYGAKYVNVHTVYDTATGELPGYFPDALVPIDALRKFNDNKIKEGHNQSIYFVVETPFNQKPGLYQGEITITLDNTIRKFPITLEVYDLQINQEVHARSVFEVTWPFESSELDSTNQMVEKYANELLEYRLSPHIISHKTKNTDEDIYNYTEKAYKFMQDPRCTNVSINEEIINIDDYIGQTFDENVLKKYLSSFFVKSMEENFNMLEKTSFFMGGIIDEPEDRKENEPWLPARTKYVCERYKICIEELANELDNVNKNHPMHDELIESLRNVRNIVSTHYHEFYEGSIETFCPKVRYYHTPEQRALYANQEEKWWYTCVDPKAPYPTYHTEDRLSSPRLLNWMQANYDVTGNLFWATNFATKMENGVNMPMDDYYNGDADRYAGCNGDGYLFYPAKQYGLDRPVGSLRLYAIRDGLEEYELLYNIKENMKANDLEDDEFFEFLTQYLYQGTVVNGGSKEVTNARDDLIKIATANSNGSDFAITNYDFDKVNNLVKLSFFAKNGTEIKVNGENATISGSHKDGLIFNASYSLSGEENVMDIEVNYNGAKTTISHVFGGENKVYKADALNGAFSKYNASIYTSKEDYGEYKDVLKMEIGKPKDRKQSIKFTPSFIDDINENIANVTFNIINPTDEDILMSIGNRYETKNYDSYFIENQPLKPGMNTIEINLAYTRWSTTGYLDYFMFVFGDNTSLTEEEKVLYLSNVVLTRKQGEK